jgi:hypothetical protein
VSKPNRFVRWGLEQLKEAPGSVDSTLPYRNDYVDRGEMHTMVMRQAAGGNPAIMTTASELPRGTRLPVETDFQREPDRPIPRPSEDARLHGRGGRENDPVFEDAKNRTEDVSNKENRCKD